MSTPLTTARMAKRAESIETRDDLNRWSIRATKRFRFLLIAYLIGALSLPLLTLFFTIESAIAGDVISLNGLFFSLLPGFCCFGPIVLLPCFVLLNSGLNNYHKAMKSLRDQHRVCEVCDAVALFDDKHVNPSKRKNHTRADLVPQMHVVSEGDQTHVLCDACLAEVNAIENIE